MKVDEINFEMKIFQFIITKYELEQTNKGTEHLEASKYSFPIE
jgi:hypothetical protein